MDTNKEVSSPQETRPSSLKDDTIVAEEATTASSEQRKLPLSKRILGIMWDSLEKTPEERKFIAKIDWWILTYCCIAYFVKYLDQTNVSSFSSSWAPEVPGRQYCGIVANVEYRSAMPTSQG